MRTFATWSCIELLSCWATLAGTPLQLVPDSELQRAFCGENRKITVAFYNPTSMDFKQEIRTRIFQASSSTALSLAEQPWKQIHVPAAETVLESATLNFPVVRGRTTFAVQWVDTSNHVIGVTAVLVYPTNLLAELKPLLAPGTLGVLDPDDALKPMLRKNSVRFVDLGETAVDRFRGTLAIIGPFHSSLQIPEGLAARIRSIALQNVAVVWLQPPKPHATLSTPPAGEDRLFPSFYLVQKDRTAVVVVQGKMVANLSENPRSQMNLIQFCRLALHPRHFDLPNPSPQF